MATQLPDYLTKTTLPRLSDRATEGMGSAMPPHISIRGNEFTLVDTSGEETSIDTKHLDVAIIDLGDVMSKLYYGNEWTPDSKDPPICWSANGIGPSKEAMTPQAPTCQQCPNNVRGSAVSKLSGASIKACRDEKWLAVLVDGYKDLIFQFRVTPGSFKNWSAYSEKFKKQPFDIRDVITRMQFEKDKNGVVTFTPANWLTPEMTALRNKLVTSKATDGIVGRLDQPIQGVLAAPTAATNTGLSGTQTQPQEKAPVLEGPKKRGPKPKEAAPAAPENGQTTMAPFRPEAAPTFGIEQPAAPPADLANDLNAFFKS
jgi:hypothetical protein